MRHHRARHVEDAADIGVEHHVDVVVVHRRQLVVADHSRVVDQDVDASGALGDALDRGSARLGIAHVDLLVRDLARAGRLVCDHFGGRVGIVAIEERHVRTVRGEQLDDRASDATAAAGDDRDLAVEPRVE